MSLEVAVDGGAAGELVALDGRHFQLVLDRAFAPGQPVRFKATAGASELTLSGKCIGCKRQPEGRFAVRLRPVDLRREHRLALEALLG